ncbi:hypothetical protein [Roseivivax sp. CAU 1753]
MMQDAKLGQQIARLETLMSDKFGASRGRLDRRVIKAGRLVPKGVRRDLDRVARAQAMAGNPKLARQLDAPAIRAAARRAEDWLASVDVADRRRGAVLGGLGALAFNLIVLFVLALVVLRWRGFI